MTDEFATGRKLTGEQKGNMVSLNCAVLECDERTEWIRLE
jgi:hypothetical protein